MNLLFYARKPIGTFEPSTQADMKPTTITLPAEAPVMVLPGTVLFPNSILPLRIFEPRYRAMLEWALEHDRMFCVAMMKPGIDEAKTDGQFFHAAGIGLISASVTQTDGTSNLMLQGLSRVRFTAFSQRSPFRIAKLEHQPPVSRDTAKVDALAEELRGRCASFRINNSPLPDAFTDALATITDPGVLADTVANSLLGEPMQRQNLIEEPDTEARLRTLVRVLG